MIYLKLASVYSIPIPLKKRYESLQVQVTTGSFEKKLGEEKKMANSGQGLRPLRSLLNALSPAGANRRADLARKEPLFTVEEYYRVPHVSDLDQFQNSCNLINIRFKASVDF